MITNIILTTKEKFLLEDQKSDEELCIQKYTNYANIASDQQLKEIFSSNAKQEHEHLDTINHLLNGQVPSSLTNKQGGSNASQQQQQKEQQSVLRSLNSSPDSQTPDKDLCSDTLMMEKHVSSAYNTAIFEFRDAQVRDILNNIQKEEQQHGEKIYKYMESKGMYSPK